MGAQKSGSARRDGEADADKDTASTSYGNDEFSTQFVPVQKPAGQLILNNIVKVGHSDDTTDESSAEDAPKVVRYRDAKKKTSAVRNACRQRSNSVSTPDSFERLSAPEVSNP